jgi:hypothetical protein
MILYFYLHHYRAVGLLWFLLFRDEHFAGHTMVGMGKSKGGD